VEGNPAVSYSESSHGDLKYARANDFSGSSWAPPIIVDSEGNVGSPSVLAIVGSNPAIAYYDVTLKDLKFVRSSDPFGGGWLPPVVVDTAGDVGALSSLVIVDGNPGISYYDSGNRDLKFVRSIDGLGATWNLPITIDSQGTVGASSSLAIIDGLPAIAYSDSTDLRLNYVRALDAAGSTWGTPIAIDPANSAGSHCSLRVVEGRPAIAFHDPVGQDLKYIRANNATGADSLDWGTAITIESSGDTGSYVSLRVIGGRPAISFYYYPGSDLKFVHASSPTGDFLADWPVPLVIDSAGSVGVGSALAEVNGQPAISYLDSTNFDLKYAYFEPTPTPVPLDDAILESHTIPAQLPQNHPMPMSLAFTNVGNTPWSDTGQYALAVQADPCGITSGNLIELEDEETVLPGNPVDFNLILSASTTLGPCNLQFQMSHNGVPFGEILSVSPEVVAAVNNADFISHALPTTMPPNTSLTYSLNFKNTGNTAWLPSSPHALGVFTSDACNLFSQTRFQPAEPVLPNKNFTAFVHITSPAAPAECTFTLQMVEELVEWFGDPLTHTITIADPPNAASNWAIYQ